MNTSAKLAVTVLKNLPCPPVTQPRIAPNVIVPMWKSLCQQAVLDLRGSPQGQVALPRPPASPLAEVFNRIP